MRGLGWKCNTRTAAEAAVKIKSFPERSGRPFQRTCSARISEMQLSRATRAKGPAESCMH